QIISSKRMNLRSDRGWALGCSTSAKDAVVQIRSSKRADKEEEEHQNQDGEGSANDSVLQASTPRRLCVWDAREGDHCVKGQIHTGQRSLEKVIELFPSPEGSRRGFVAHLNKIADCQIGERVSISFSA